MRRGTWSGAIIVVALALHGSVVAADPALDSLVANERAFAALAGAKGMKEAFLTYLAEDGVVFEPTATNGRKAWEARPPSSATLLWEPAFVQVSSSGDLGYSTGPWELRPPADSSGVAAPAERFVHGHFHSIWKKQRGGVWRVLADIGVSHRKPVRGGVGNVTIETGPVLPRRTMKRGRVDLRKVDDEFSRAMRAVGTAEAIALHAAPDVRLSVEGRIPALGIGNAQARFDSVVGFFDFKPEEARLAASGDLGYTYGLAERFVSTKAEAAADTSVYLHVWRQEDGRTWKLALGVIKPLARP